MLRHGGGMIALRLDQLPAPQKIERGLHRGLRQAGFYREQAQTCRDRFPFRPGRPAVEMKINEIRGRLSIMPDDIAHQDVEDVIVDGNCFAKTRHVQKDEG